MPITFNQRGRGYLSPSLAIALRPRDNWQQKRADKDRALVYQAEVARQMKAEADARDLQVSQMQETLSTVSRLGFLKKDEETLKAWNTKKQDELTKHISEKYSGDVNKFLAIEGDRWKAAYVRELADNPDYASGLKNKTNYGLYQDAQTKSGLVVRPVQYNRMNEETGKYELVQGTIEQNLIDYQSGKAKDIGWNATFEAPKDAKKFFNTNEAPDLSKEVTPNDLVQYGMSAGLNQQDATLWAQQAMKNDKWLWKNGEWDRNMKVAQLELQKENADRSYQMQQARLAEAKKKTAIAQRNSQLIEQMMNTPDPTAYMPVVDPLDPTRARSVVISNGGDLFGGKEQYSTGGSLYWLNSGRSHQENAMTRFGVTKQEVRDEDGDIIDNQYILPLNSMSAVYAEVEDEKGNFGLKPIRYGDPKFDYWFKKSNAGSGVAVNNQTQRLHYQNDMRTPEEKANGLAPEKIVDQTFVQFKTKDGKTLYLPYETQGVNAITDKQYTTPKTKAQREAVSGALIQQMDEDLGEDVWNTN